MMCNKHLENCLYRKKIKERFENTSVVQGWNLMLKSQFVKQGG